MEGKGEDYLFGLRALQDGHLEAAILAFETFLKEQPKDPRRAEAKFFLAEAKLEKGLSAEALDKSKLSLSYIDLSGTVGISYMLDPIWIDQKNTSAEGLR